MKSKKIDGPFLPLSSRWRSSDAYRSLNRTAKGFWLDLLFESDDRRSLTIGRVWLDREFGIRPDESHMDQPSLKALAKAGMVRLHTDGLDLIEVHSVSRWEKSDELASNPPTDRQQTASTPPVDGQQPASWRKPSANSQGSESPRIEESKKRIEENTYVPSAPVESAQLALVEALPADAGVRVSAKTKVSESAQRKQSEAMALFGLWAKVRGERFPHLGAVKPLASRLAKATARLQRHTVDELARAILGAFDDEYMTTNEAWLEFESLLGSDAKVAKNQTRADKQGLRVGPGCFMAAWDAHGFELFDGWFDDSKNQRAIAALIGAPPPAAAAPTSSVRPSLASVPVPPPASAPEAVSDEPEPTSYFGIPITSNRTQEAS